MVIDSIRAEYLRYKALAEAAMRQLSEEELVRPAPDGGNSIVTICWHIAGNLRSRFTDFLTADGEKPWRNRDDEFEPRTASRGELLARWEDGWRVLLDALSALKDEDLQRPVTIRGERLPVHEALHRSLAHTSYHVGQIVYAAKALRGDAWVSLSIARGASAQYNTSPSGQAGEAHASRLASIGDNAAADRP